MPTQLQIQQYREIISNPDKIEKLAKLEFLNDDNTIAFVVDNTYKRGYGGYTTGSRAFLQDGSLSVSLQNGKRRQASIVFENLDNEFDYSISQWVGQRIRLSMGLILPDGSPYYLPQGVFYVDSPELGWKPNSRQISYTLTDKWSYLDGSLFGKLRDTYQIKAGENLFAAMRAVLRLSKYTLDSTFNLNEMIDNVEPQFTNYFNTRITAVNGKVFSNNQVPYDILIESGKYCSDIITELNDLIAGIMGYDALGRFTVIPSESDISDQTKPILWDFSSSNNGLFEVTETVNIGEICNEYIVIGEARDSETVPVGRAINNDPASDTSIGRIGRKPVIESASGYYSKEQCAALAAYKLKRATVLQKSIAISCPQMFHLSENNLITVQRTDKAGQPIERHLIQSYTLPVSQNGTMTINATSVMDYPNIEIKEDDYGVL